MDRIPAATIRSATSCAAVAGVQMTPMATSSRRTPLRLEEVFIDGDDDLERDYGTRVPVVEVGGAEAFEYHVDPAALRRLLEPCAFVRGRSQSR